MLAAAALRLAVIEALCPTAAIASGTGFPTLAQHRVFDSRQILVDELDTAQAFTPAISVYAEDTRMVRRGDIATSVRGNAYCDLAIVVEMAELARDAEGQPIRLESDNLATDAVINGDPLVRLTLEALTAQVRRRLLRDPSSWEVRKLLKAVSNITVEPFALPQYSLRWARNVMTMSCEIGDDKFTDEGGLPEPAKTVLAALPDGSYAKTKLTELGDLFLATERTPLAGFNLHPTTGDGAPAITPPAP